MRTYWMALIIIAIMCVGSIGYCESEISSMLQTGKSAIENGEYEKAVDSLGKILEVSGNQSNDDKIVAFGATVQAYGLWKMNNPQMNPMVVDYLNKAIARDPSWEYPKKLLKEVENKK